MSCKMMKNEKRLKLFGRRKRMLGKCAKELTVKLKFRMEKIKS